MRKAEFDQQVEAINQRILAIHAEILAVRLKPERWFPLYLKVSGPFWQDLSHRLMELVMVGRSAFNLATLGKLQEVAAQTERHHLAVQRTVTELVPWIPLFENPPTRFRDARFVKTMTALRTSLPYNIAFGQIHGRILEAKQHIATLDRLLTSPTDLVEGLVTPGAAADLAARRMACEVSPGTGACG